MLIRPKTAADTEAVTAMALDVHRRDGYPRYLPDHLAEFMCPEYEEAAWVADLHGQVLGHVALHNAAVDPTLLAAQRATGSALIASPSWRVWSSHQKRGAVASRGR